MGPRRSGHSLYKQPGVNHISAMAQSEGGHHSSSKTQTKSKSSLTFWPLFFGLAGNETENYYSTLVHKEGIF